VNQDIDEDKDRIDIWFKYI